MGTAKKSAKSKPKTKPTEPTEKRKKGRPSLYKKDFPAVLLQYFHDKIDAGELPFLSAFAREKAKVHEAVALDWAKKHSDFDNAYKVCKELQKEFLIKQAMTGKLNPTVFIFTAKNMTDMRDQQDHKVSVQGIESALAGLDAEKK